MFENLPHSDTEKIPTKTGASSYDSAIDTTLSSVKLLIPHAVINVEEKIASSNFDKKILFYTNYVGMVSGLSRTLNQEINNIRLKKKIYKYNNSFSVGKKKSLSPKQKKKLEELYTKSWGHLIQAFTQVAYGYGYWGRFRKIENSKLPCGLEDLENTLKMYSEVLNERFRSLNPIMAEVLATEINVNIKESLHCLISKSHGNRLVKELISYIDLYTYHLSENSDE